MMKKIVKTIRRKWAEYLLEVIVIVGSILGAFALDEWNESRKEKKIKFQILNGIKKELNSNKELLESVSEKHQKGINQITALLKLYSKPFSVSSTFDLDSLIKWSLINSIYITYDPSLGYVKSIINSGRIGLVTNDDLVVFLSQFEDKIVDVNEDILLNRQIWSNQASNVFKNYIRWGAPEDIKSKFLPNLEGFFNDPDTEFWLRNIGKRLEVQLVEENILLNNMEETLLIIDKELETK